MTKPRWKADGATLFEHGRIAATCYTPKGAQRMAKLLNDAGRVLAEREKAIAEKDGK